MLSYIDVGNIFVLYGVKKIDLCLSRDSTRLLRNVRRWIEYTLLCRMAMNLRKPVVFPWFECEMPPTVSGLNAR